MKQHFKIITVLQILFLFFTAVVKGQNTAGTDSLFLYLSNIKSVADSDNIKQAFDWLYKSKADVLLKDYIINTIGSLKNKVDERDYYDLANDYFARLSSINTEAANQKAIAVAKQWIVQNENATSKYGHYSTLITLRELRIPFRNSGKLNESIEYYTSIEKKYLEARDSDAVSVVYNVLSGSYNRLGQMEKARYYQLKSIEYLNDKQEDYKISRSAMLFGKAGKVNRYSVLGSYYIDEKKPAVAEGYLHEAIQYFRQLDSPMLMTDAPFIFLQLARCKTLEKNANSASYYDTALNYLNLYDRLPLEYAHYFQEKTADFISKNIWDSALNNINRAIQLKDSFRLPIISYFGELRTDFYKALVLLKKGAPKDAVSLLQNEIKELRLLNSIKLLIEDLSLLAEAHEASGNAQEAYQTISEAFALKEKLTMEQNDARSLNFEAEKKMQERENTILLLDTQNKASQKTKYYLFGILGLLGLFITVLTVFYSNKKKANRELALKNERLAYTIQQLQTTQAQLVQSEKMASLGELTAGIAHEIQNPLNFVNNFSEVSNELIDEMNEEIAKGNYEEVKAIAVDVKQNLEKINHHGKRADAIVKGMLQHSRSSNGAKEPTDINKLTDEYLRLAYHGIRAKDNSFNATLKTDFDESIGNINIIPQDIGRVILNLITNAFYVVDEKKKSGVENYEPVVLVSTKKTGDKFFISVKDNGNGIPQKVLDKIFQPFFTTKPTGQGTGLGLSLSYDIIKAHGGELKVDTKEGEFAEFVITLPV